MNKAAVCITKLKTEKKSAFYAEANSTFSLPFRQRQLSRETLIKAFSLLNKLIRL